MVLDDELKAMVLHKLAKKRKWGESHTAFENVAKGVPPHLKGKLKDVAKELIKEGYIIPKPTGYGLQISLNVERSEEIRSIIRRYFENEVI
ncbi:MAG TPA: hypothetical protein VJH24_05060 [Candidatus Bilamarchaeaceae archaeon]|nr:hypothetical protein [Candidatus Bilamarchaeaceae archaeon]